MYTIWIIISLNACAINFSNGYYRGYRYDPFQELFKLVTKTPTNRSLWNGHNFLRNLMKVPDNPNLDNTHFCPLINHQEQATRVDETTYPWIARVFHSLTGNTPFICTAAAVNERLFITAARCLATSKVRYTSVLYQNTRLLTKAFVHPSKPTIQMYDDIGIIVVHDEPKPTSWILKEPLAKRRNEKITWFEDMGFENFAVFGFVLQKNNLNLQDLYKLSGVSVSSHLCNSIIPKSSPNDYWAPCYYQCSLDDFQNKNPNCQRSLVGLGNVVVAQATPWELVGVATWSCGRPTENNLPVGIAVPNSESYYEDLGCAIKIRDDRKIEVGKGYYQSLCDKKLSGQAP